MSVLSKLATAKLTKALLVMAVLLSGGLFVQTASAHAEYVYTGAVYVLTNSVTDNQVMVFSRTPEGRLLPEDSYSTGGLGTGASLASQGALIGDRDGDWLFAVNAASNDISVFATFGSRLFLTDKITSDGVHPVSLTLHQNMLYVLNGGDADNAANITGYTVSDAGKLTPLANSTRPLSTAAPGAAEVKFSPDGGLLTVTEKGTNMIDTYTVGLDSLPTGPMTHAAAGMTPYGFAYDNNSHLITAEAAGGPPNISAVSSYKIGADGSLTTVSGSSTTHQLAACWIAVSQDGKYAYAANTGSGTISGYSIGADGGLTLLDANGVTAVAQAGTADLSISHNGDFLYALNGGGKSISAFEINADGSLSWIRGMDGLPAGVVGLVAW